MCKNQLVLSSSVILIATKMKSVEIDVTNIDFTMPITFYSKMYGLSDNAMRNRFKRLGVYDSFIFTGKNKHVSVIRGDIMKREYEKNPTLCKQCGTPLTYVGRCNHFCSRHCSAIWSNANRPPPSDECRKRISTTMREKYSRGELSVPSTPAKRSEVECPTCHKKFLLTEWAINHGRKFCSRHCSAIGKDNSKCGGLRQNSGRGKSGWYKGIFCNSSWELAWVIYSIDHGEVFTRNTTGFDYTFNGKLHRYYPDFLLNDGVTFVEVKGYNTEQWKAKKEQFPHTLHIVGKDEIKPYIKYVTEKYGTDFIRLYEGNPHNEKKNTCQICGKPCKNMYCSRECGGKAVGHKNFSPC